MEKLHLLLISVITNCGILICNVQSALVCGNLQEGYLYFFTSMDRSCAIDATGHAIVPTYMQTYATNNATGANKNQNYFIKQLPSQNYYMIFNFESNLTLDTNSTNLWQQYPTCVLSQQFYFSSGPNNSCYIFSGSSANNSVLTRNSGSCNSQKITVKPLQNLTNQQWYFLPTGISAPQIYPSLLLQTSTSKNFISTTINVSTTVTKRSSTSTQHSTEDQSSGLTTSLTANNNNSVCQNLQEGYAYYFGNFEDICVIDGPGHLRTPGYLQTYANAHNITSNPNQLYFIQRIPPLNTYFIFNFETNLTFDIKMTNLTQQHPTCEPTQQFYFSNGLNNSCYIYSASSPDNNVLSRNNKTCDGEALTLQPLTSSDTQQWYFIQTTKIAPQIKVICPTTTSLTTTMRQTTEFQSSNLHYSTMEFESSSLKTSSPVTLTTARANPESTLYSNRILEETEILDSLKTSMNDIATTTLKTCVIDNWSDYEPCSATCGHTIYKKRTRKVLQNGSICPYPMTDLQLCDVKICNPMTQTEQQIAYVLQTIGCAWIIGIMAASFALSIVFWSSTTARFLHASEELCLLLAHCIISYARSETSSGVICTLAGIGLQYFFLVHFTCLALESFHIYSILTTVVNTESFFSIKSNAFFAWVFPLVITAFTAVTSFHHYISTYSCWLNIGSNISIATFLPVVCCTFISSILLESTAQFNVDAKALNQPSKRGLLFILPLNFLAWFIGLLAIYEQNFGWFATVFHLNLAISIAVGFFHILSNEKVIMGRQFVQSVWKKIFCKK